MDKKIGLPILFVVLLGLLLLFLVTDRKPIDSATEVVVIEGSAVRVGSLVPVEDAKKREKFEGHWKLMPGQSDSPPRKIPLEMEVEHAVITRLRIPDDPAYDAQSKMRYRLYFDEDEKNYLVRAAPLDWAGALDGDAISIIDELQFTDDRNVIKIRCEYPDDGKNVQDWWVYHKQNASVDNIK